MRDQPQGWSDPHEPVMEEVPAQRPPAEDQPAGTGPDVAWAPPAERVAATMPGAWMPAGAPAQMAAAGQPYQEERTVEDAERQVEDEDRAVAQDGRAVGVASVSDEGTTRDETSRDESAPDESAQDEDAHDEAARDHELEKDAALHNAAHDAEHEPRAGGVPDDAVSQDDAPAPAAAYGVTEATDATDVADSSAAGTEAGVSTEAGDTAEGREAAEAGDKTELMPGDVPDEPASALFDPGAAESFRNRWQRVQMQFVDDPRSAAEQARALVDDVFAALREALTNQRGALDDWQSGQSGDTEQLRVAVRRYRDFLNRMLGL